MVPALASRLPALEAAMPMALASRPASSPSRCPAATAEPSGPAAPGGWKRILRASNCPDACRIQPCISTPLTSAASTSRPLSPRASASASTPASVVESAWFAGLHIGSKSSTCMAAPLSAAAETVLRRKPLPIAVACGGAALLLVVRGKDMDRLFLGAGDGDGDAVEHQPPRGGDGGRTEIGIAGGGNLLTQLRRHRHA